MNDSNPTTRRAGLLLLLSALLMATGFLSAQQMNYQGRLTDANGAPLGDGQYTITFNIYDAGGTVVWGPFQCDGGAGNGRAPKADLVNGRFNVVLGPNDTGGDPLGDAFDTSGGAPRFLGIQLSGSPQISPRQQILAAPTALYANHANTANTASNFTSNVLFTDETNQRVGIGTATPGKRLDVDGDIRGSLIVRPGGSYENGAIFSNSAWGMLFRSAQSSPSVAVFSFADGNDAKLMTMVPGGNIGIGTTNPSQKLHVEGTATVTGFLGVGSTNPVARLHVRDPGAETGRIHVGGTGANGSAKLITFGDSSIVSIGENGADDRMELKARKFYFDPSGGSGNVGISGSLGVGIDTATRGKLEVSGSVSTTVNIGGFLNRNGAGDLSNTNRASTVSIYASNEIAGSEMLAHSDARIKEVEGRSIGVDDLKVLECIEITDYTFKDKIGKGSRLQKKVVAQQVAEVYPQAVRTITDIVPDIYEKAAIKDGWIMLDTDLKQGDRVRLIGEKKERVHKVLEVRDGAFRTDFTSGGDEVFVYGREVDDFHLVDYEAIAMLNVSATQELHRQLLTAQADLAARTAEISTLEERLAALESRDKARDAKLTRLEQVLLGGATAIKVAQASDAVK